jgi:hypothetical protein
MFPLVVRSDVSKSICNEFRCSFRLDSLLILLVTSLLTPGGNILLVSEAYTKYVYYLYIILTLLLIGYIY